jgi:hypothetical protein
MFRLKSLLLLFVPLVVYGATIIPDGLITDQLDVDNVRVDANTVSTTNTNGDLTFDLNGTGSVIFSDLTATTVPYLDASKKLTSSAATPTQLGYLANATSNICGISQACTLTNKTLTSPTINGATFSGSVGLGVSASRALVTDGSGNVAASAVTSTELGYSSGVTSSLCGISQSCTLSNKTLTNPTISGAIGLGVSYASKILVADTFGIMAASTASAAEAAQLVGVTSTLCGINQACTLTNKTLTGPVIDAVVFDDQASTPSSPSSGYYKIYAKTDGKAYLLNSSGVESPIGSGGGSGGINYIANPDAQSDTTGWATYDDSSATLVDGTGGTFNSAFTRSTSASEQVRQNSISSGVFKFAKDAANRQGEGVCYNFLADRIDLLNATQKVSFDYLTTSNYADDDMYVAVYAHADGPQVIGIRNSDNGYIKKAVANSKRGRFEGYFETDNINLNFRVCLHVRTTNASAYDLLFDNFQVGPTQTYPSFDLATQVTIADNTGNVGAGGAVVGTVTTVTGSGIYTWSSGTYTFLKDAWVDATCMMRQGSTQSQPQINMNGSALSLDYVSTNTAWASASASYHVLAGQTVSCTNGVGAGTSDIQKFTIRAIAKVGNQMSADAFNSQFPEPLKATSTQKTPSASSTWQAYASSTNALTLTQGTWRLWGSCTFGSNGSVPNYNYTICAYYGGNGADSASTPTALSSAVTVKSVVGSGDNVYSTAIGASITSPAQEAIVTCASATCTVYLNTYIQATTASNARITVYPNAMRIPDYTLYGNVNKPPTKQIFTSSGTYTKPSGVRYVDYIVIGGGGDGGGSVVNGSGSGGGAGGMSQGTLSYVPSSMTITVGSRGAPGGASSIAGTGITTITANGGTNGVCCNTAGGVGGSASGGEINTTGQSGSNGYYLTSDFDPGDGGSTIFPGGGRGAGTAIGTNALQNATGYGNGGGGSANGAGGGGSGTSGIVIIKEYY